MLLSHVRDAIEMCGGDLPRAAKELGVGKTSIYRYARKLGIDPSVRRELVDHTRDAERLFLRAKLTQEVVAMADATWEGRGDFRIEHRDQYRSVAMHAMLEYMAAGAPLVSILPAVGRKLRASA